MVDTQSMLQEALRLHGAGELDRAEAFYERVLATAPGQPDALHLLGVLCIQRQRFQRAVELIAAAVRASPGNPDYHSNLGVGLRALGREAEAAQAFQQALALNPEHPNASYNLAIAQRSLGRLDEALSAMADAVAREPRSAERRLDLAGLLLEAGRFAEALAACDRCLVLAPRDRLAIGYKAVALSQCQQAPASARLLAMDRVIRPRRLPLPPGWTREADLCADLARYVREHPTLREPVGRATTHGRQTGELLTGRDEMARALETLIDTAVAEYLDALPRDPTHPWLASHPRRWTLTAWGVVLENQGYQAPHAHPAGWASGVFYVALPEGIGTGDGDQAGWIEFGCVPDEFPVTVSPPVMRLAPEEGLMVQFPSYLQHRTIAFQASTPRISIAFDAIPVPDTA